MGVDVVGNAVGGPAGVGYSYRAFRLMVAYKGFKVGNFAFGFA